MKFYMPPQITRLALAFAIFICLFWAARYFFKPDTFGEKGPYRAAALIDNAQLEIHFSGQDACFECHQDIQDLKLTDLHSEIHCETCHGPGQEHVLSSLPEDIIKPSDRKFCGSCHLLNAARLKDAVNQVDLKTHNIDKNCIECHNPHQPWEMIE